MFSFDNSDNGDDVTRNIASAIRFASGDDRDAEAAIINMSLSVFSDGTQQQDDFILDIGAAMDQAADEGKIIVVAAGNEGAANPTIPARFVNTGDVTGLGIAVGSVGSNNTISGFSNRCGDVANFCMVAPGEGVDAPLIDDQFGEVSGTSFAAPLVSGSAAVVKAAFPGIGNRDVVSRLLSTARDLGASGTDDIYGRGLLDLEAALAPVGELSVSLSNSVDGAQARTASSQISLDSSVAISSDAQALLANTMLLDEQNFPFLADLNRNVDQRSRATGIESFIGADRSLTTLMVTDQANVSLSFSEQPPELTDPHRLEFAKSDTALQEQAKDPRISFRSEAGQAIDLFMSFNGTSGTGLGIGQSLAADEADFFGAAGLPCAL